MKNTDYARHERWVKRRRARRMHRASACLLLLILFFGIRALVQFTNKNGNQDLDKETSSQDTHLTSQNRYFWNDNTAVSKGDVVTANELNLRSGPSAKYGIVCFVPSGTKITLTGELNTDGTWIKVQVPGGKSGWCCRPYLQSDVVDTAANHALVQVAYPLSIKGSLDDQKVMVFDAKGLAIKTFTCSSGESGSETPTGTFSVSNRGISFYNSNLGEGAYYWTSFYGDYLFHSIPFNQDYEIKQNEAEKLGTPASHGCIRLSMDDAKWIYDHIQDGTKVTVQ